jgi:hypothetical protein
MLLKCYLCGLIICHLLEYEIILMQRTVVTLYVCVEPGRQRKPLGKVCMFLITAAEDQGPRSHSYVVVVAPSVVI